MYIGKRLKKIRKQKGIKLSELADLTGIQLATLSRIENMKMRGTVESHLKIARALSINITDLYTDSLIEEKNTTAQNPAESLDLFSPNQKTSCEILISHVLSKKMLPTRIEIEPKGKIKKEQLKKGTEKFLYVLKGKLEITIGGKIYHLSANHSLYFDASLIHSIVNESNITAKILSIVTPVTL